MFMITQHKYEKYYPFVKIIKTIHIQILIKIVLLIFNNLLELYGIIENNISNIKENTNLKWIKNNIRILEELID